MNRNRRRMLLSSLTNKADPNIISSGYLSSEYTMDNYISNPNACTIRIQQGFDVDGTGPKGKSIQFRITSATASVISSYVIKLNVRGYSKLTTYGCYDGSNALYVGVFDSEVTSYKTPAEITSQALGYRYFSKYNVDFHSSFTFDVTNYDDIWIVYSHTATASNPRAYGYVTDLFLE